MRLAKSWITPAAIGAFRRALTIEVEGDADRWEEKGGRRLEYLDTWLALHRALGLAPWKASPLDVSEGERPDYIDEADWQNALSLARQLLSYGKLHADA